MKSDDAQRMALIQTNRKEVGRLLQIRAETIANLLPTNVTQDRFNSIVMHALRTDSNLAVCTPQSIIGAVIECASLGLEVGQLAEAYFVPRWSKNVGAHQAQLMPSYKGLMKLARNTGTVDVLEAFVVYEGDDFEYAYGDSKHQYIKHAPNPSGPEIHFTYARAVLKSGQEQFRVATIADLKRAEQLSESAQGRYPQYSPWNTAREAMSMKTAVRMLMKWLPQNTQSATAMHFDDSGRSDLGRASQEWLDAYSANERDITPPQGNGADPEPQQPRQRRAADDLLDTMK